MNIIQEHSKNHLQTAFNLGVQINLLETKLEQHREKLRQAYAENPQAKYFGENVEVQEIK